MRYKWNECKNVANQRKHDGISFELASLVFEDENRLVGLDRVGEDGEERWHAIGVASVEPDISAVLLVVHAYRENRDGEEIIRIISARRANKHEIRRYREQEVD